MENMKDIEVLDTQYDLSLKVPDTQKGYFDEIVIWDSSNIDKFTFSNNLDDIEVAIYAKTGKTVKLKDATWKVCDNFSVKIRHMMKNYGVNYSMIAYSGEEDNYVDVYMHSGDKWFMAEYIECESIYYDWNNFLTMKKTIKWLKDKESEKKDDDS